MDFIVPASQLALFVPAVLVLILTPGPVVLYIVTRSVDQGRTAGMASVFASFCGNLCHVLAAAFGVSAILLSSSLAFDLVKYLGAAYLIYLGIRKLRSKDVISEQTVRRDSLRRIFTQGVIVAILNPKAALFFFAFLPQFVDPSRGSVALQILFLGAIMLSMAMVSDSAYALLSGSAGHWLRGNLRYLRFQRYFSGTVYIGLGLTAAFAGGSKK